MKELAVPLIAGAMLFLSGGYIIYQALLDSGINSHNVTWLQGSAGVVIGVLVAFGGVLVVVIGAARYARQRNRFPRY